LAERKRRPAEEKPLVAMDVDLEQAVLARPVLKRGGRREWFRVARSELEARRAQQAQAIARARDDRLLETLERSEENQRVDLAANEAYERWRATARDTKGRVLKGNRKPFTPPELPDGVINLSDPDSRVMRTQGTPPRQAFNAQAAVNDGQIILAAEVTVDSPDFGHLEPTLKTTPAHLERQGISELPDVVIADAGYWHTRQIEAVEQRGIEVLIPPESGARGQPAGLGERSLSTNARHARHRARTQALRQAQDDDRAGVRPDQIQPAHRPVHAKRPGRRAVGVAARRRHPQSPGMKLPG
jgi:hypothetical protein